MAKRRVAQHTTLLVIGEGADDQAFINHMKGLYCLRGCGRSAKIEAGDGGSPGNIITTAIRAFKGVDYDRNASQLTLTGIVFIRFPDCILLWPGFYTSRVTSLSSCR